MSSSAASVRPIPEPYPEKGGRAPRPGSWSEAARLIAALKRAFKAYAKTYADTDHYLNLSEASVKRLFSQKSISLQRLDLVCLVMRIEISELQQTLPGRCAVLLVTSPTQ